MKIPVALPQQNARRTWTILAVFATESAVGKTFERCSNSSLDGSDVADDVAVGQSWLRQRVDEQVAILADGVELLQRILADEDIRRQVVQDEEVEIQRVPSRDESALAVEVSDGEVDADAPGRQSRAAVGKLEEFPPFLANPEPPLVYKCGTD